MKKDFENIIQDLGAKANTISMNDDRLVEIIEAVKEKLENNEISEAIVDNVKESIEMIIAWNDGEYTEIPRNTVLLVIGGLVYLVNPFGIVPENLKKNALVDLLVIGYILKATKDELEKYKIWKEEVGYMETEKVKEIEKESDEEETNKKNEDTDEEDKIVYIEI